MLKINHFVMDPPKNLSFLRLPSLQTCSWSRREDMQHPRSAAEWKNPSFFHSGRPCPEHRPSGTLPGLQARAADGGGSEAAVKAVAVTAPGAAEGTSADEVASDSSSGGVGGLGPLFDEGGDAGSAAAGVATALASLNLQENDKASGAAVYRHPGACQAPACLGCQLRHRRVSNAPLQWTPCAQVSRDADRPPGGLSHVLPGFSYIILLM